MSGQLNQWIQFLRTHHGLQPWPCQTSLPKAQAPCHTHLSPITTSNIYIGSKRSVCLCIWLYQSCYFLWSAILVLTLTLFLVFMTCLCLVYSVCWSPDLSLCLTLILFPVLDLSVRLSLKIFFNCNCIHLNLLSHDSIAVSHAPDFVEDFIKRHFHIIQKKRE